MDFSGDGLLSDQYFLVNFIMSNYLGPDVYSDNPRCSASERLAKGLPPYTLKHIGSSSLTVVQLHNLYYNVLRHAKSSLILHPDMFHMYLKGYLPLEPIPMFHEFTCFFPMNLHPHKRYSQTHEIVKGIVVIDDPAVAFINKEELHRFRCLSGLNNLKIERVLSLSHQHVLLNESQGTEQNCSRNREATSNGIVSDQNCNSSVEPQEICQKKKEEEKVADHAACVINKTPERNGIVSNQDCNASIEPQETWKRKKEEEAVAGYGPSVINKTPERNGVQTIVSDQDCNAPTEPQETRKRKKEEDAVADHGPSVINKTPKRNEVATSNGIFSDHDCNSIADPLEICKRKKEEEEGIAGHDICVINKTPERFRETYKRKRFKSLSAKSLSQTNKNEEILIERDKTDQPNSLALVPVPDLNESLPEPSFVSTGTASKGTLGPPIGAVDIGVNKVAYFFQVALPGVRKDYGEFSCEIESDGKVILEGSTTTGGKTMKRHARVFEMNLRPLCPPGPFKLSFSLPGPVDPRLFSPKFRSDGIFEAVIIKHEH